MAGSFLGVRLPVHQPGTVCSPARGVLSCAHKGYFLSPAVIIGANEEGQLLAEQLVKWQYSGPEYIWVSSIITSFRLPPRFRFACIG